MRRIGLFLLVLGCDGAVRGYGGYEPIGGGLQIAEGSGAGPQGGAAQGGAPTTTTATTTTGTGMMPCPDDAEPNDTIDTAWDLGEITDSDSDGKDFLGVIATGGDEDWFRYHGTDATGSTVDPTRDIAGTTNVVVCKYLQCDNGEATDFTCPMGTMAASEGTIQGCCWSDDLPHAIDLTCGSSALNADNATIWIKIASDGTQSGCVEYLLTLHY